MEKSKNLWNKFKKLFFFEENVSTRRKIYNSLWAILFGLIISSIFIMILGSNPFEVFAWMISNSFNQASVQNETLLTIAVFIFASIAVGIAFKSGMFNIGVPGQMMVSGILSIIIVVSLSPKNNDGDPISTNAGILILAVLVGSIVSALTGAIAGALKAYLKVNEVITTILLNWIIYYIAYYFLRSAKSPFTSRITPLGNSKTIPLSDFFFTPEFAVIVLFLAIIFAFGIWFVIKGTTLGYKIKANGLNKDASKYSGTNEKMMTISILAFSGLISGIAGFIWFILLKRGMIMGSSPLPEGFDSIAVSLLAYNSPLGIIGTSVFYSFLSIGSKSLQFINYKLDSTTAQIIIGIIIYLAAISTIFSKFRLIQKLIKFIFYIKSGIFYRSKNKKLFKEFKQTFREGIQTKGDKNDVNYLEKELLLYTQWINKIKSSTTNKEISIFKSYYLVKILEYKKYFKSKKILRLKNQSNKTKWQELNKELKNNFFDKTQDKNIDSLELFRQLSNKKRDINKQLFELGYFDQKILKEQFKATKISNKTEYSKFKQEITNDFLSKNQWIKMEVK